MTMVRGGLVRRSTLLSVDGAAQVVAASGRTLQQNADDLPSLFSFPGSNANARFAAAKAAGVRWLFIPAGDHTISGWTIAEADSLSGLVFAPGARLIATASINSIGLDIQKNLFRILGECWIDSSGTSSDGLFTVALRHGHPTIGGKAFLDVDSIRYSGFSKRGIVSYQPVFIRIGSIRGTGVTGLSELFGLSIEPATIEGIGLVPATTVQIGRAYISGALRGINIESAGWVTLGMSVLEYCGSSTTEDGALHLTNCSIITIQEIYGEKNARNIVRRDSSPVVIGGAMLPANAPDIVTYSGMAFNQRGSVQIRGNTINARQISHDVAENADLQIGSNIIVPAAGGSVIFGAETMASSVGTLVSGIWSTVYTIPANEMTGGGQLRAMYEYVCYAGTSDLTTGFDSGTILNGTLRSHSGSVPAWLRIAGNSVQMNVTSAAYGLNYKIAMRRMLPGV